MTDVVSRANFIFPPRFSALQFVGKHQRGSFDTMMPLREKQKSANKESKCEDADDLDEMLKSSFQFAIHDFHQIFHFFFYSLHCRPWFAKFARWHCVDECVLCFTTLSATCSISS